MDREKQLPKLTELFLSHCLFIGLTKDGLTYRATQNEIKSLPPPSELWISVDDSRVTFSLIFSGQVIDTTAMFSIERATLQNIYYWGGRLGNRASQDIGV